MSLKKAKLQKPLEFDVEEVKQFITKNPNSRIYLGCDSIRLKNKIRYATVVCIHYNGSRGAKIFGEVTYGNLIDNNLSKPINRMLEEVNKIIEMYNELEEVLIDRVDDVSIHLDINPLKSEGSNIAYGAAKGMIQGILGIDPVFKPNAFISSHCADYYCNNI